MTLSLILENIELKKKEQKKMNIGVSWK